MSGLFIVADEKAKLKCCGNCRFTELSNVGLYCRYEIPEEVKKKIPYAAREHMVAFKYGTSCPVYEEKP